MERDAGCDKGKHTRQGMEKEEEQELIKDRTKVWTVSLYLCNFLVHLSGVCEKVIGDLNGCKFHTWGDNYHQGN